MNRQNGLAGVFGYSRRYLSPVACKQSVNPADANTEAENPPPTDVVLVPVMVIMFPRITKDVLKLLTDKPWILKVLASVALVYIGWGAISTTTNATIILYHNLTDPFYMQFAWNSILQAHGDFAIAVMLIVLFYLAARYFVNRQVLRRFHVYITMGIASTTIFWGSWLHWLWFITR